MEECKVRRRDERRIETAACFDKTPSSDGAASPKCSNDDQNNSMACGRPSSSMNASCSEEESTLLLLSDDDDASIYQDCGEWDGSNDSWKGCVCNNTHPRPTVVFWIQCDGACQSWYNVSSDCVGFDQQEANSMVTWSCPKCSEMSPQISHFLNLPFVLMYHIVTFVAPPMERAAVLCHQIAPLCLSTRHAVFKEPWSGVWSLLLENEYRGGAFYVNRGGQHSSPSRKRRRFFLQAIDKVREAHTVCCENTDDVHMSLSAMCDDEKEPLTLKRFRSILAEHGRPRLMVDRPSSFGRTLLMECCAANFVDEGVVLRCIKELVEVHDADPNVFSKDEKPYADRPVLYFAIARVMPSVVKFLVSAGASLDVRVEGCYRLVSDPSNSICGSFTPLGFAKALKAAEAASKGQLPSYYISKLNVCIRILSKAEICAN